MPSDVDSAWIPGLTMPGCSKTYGLETHPVTASRPGRLQQLRVMLREAAAPAPRRPWLHHVAGIRLLLSLLVSGSAVSW